MQKSLMNTSSEVGLSSNIENIENPLAQFERHIKNLNHKELKLVVKKLNYLGKNFDPYAPDLQPIEVSNLIAEYALSQYLDNPFHFTNILLQMMDKTENTLKEREH